MIVTVTDATVGALLRESERPVLLEFTASWCPPCRMLEPVLREIAEEQADRLVVARIDADANPATTLAAGVLGMPTLILHRGGEPVAQVVGARPKAALLRLLEEHLTD